MYYTEKSILFLYTGPEEGKLSWSDHCMRLKLWLLICMVLPEQGAAAQCVKHTLQSAKYEFLACSQETFETLVTQI